MNRAPMKNSNKLNVRSLQIRCIRIMQIFNIEICYIPNNFKPNRIINPHGYILYTQTFQYSAETSTTKFTISGRKNKLLLIVIIY